MNACVAAFWSYMLSLAGADVQGGGHSYLDGGVAEGVYRVKANTPLAAENAAGTLFIGCAYN